MVKRCVAAQRPGTGATCEQRQTQLSFHGNVRAVLQSALKSSDLSLRVRMATQTAHVQLLADYTTPHSEVDRFQLVATGGCVSCRVWGRCASTADVVISDPVIADGEWHSVNVSLSLASSTVTLIIDGSSVGNAALLSSLFIVCDQPTERLDLGGSASNSSLGFTGCLGSVHIGNQQVNLSAGSLSGDTTFGCMHSTARLLGASALRFPASNWALNGSVEIRLRTTSMDGLIYYTRESATDANANVTTDYVALQVVNGFVRATVKFNVNSPAIVLHSSVAVSDNTWHTISASRNNTAFTLAVDSSSTSSIFSSSTNFLDTGFDVCLGGVGSSSKVIGGLVVSPLRGCLSEYKQNGHFVSMLSHTQSVNVAFGSCSLAT